MHVFRVKRSPASSKCGLLMIPNSGTTSDATKKNKYLVKAIMRRQFDIINVLTLVLERTEVNEMRAVSSTFIECFHFFVMVKAVFRVAVY